MDNTSTNAKIEQIITAFSTFDGKYKRAEVEWANQHRQEIAPHLMTILQNSFFNSVEEIEAKNPDMWEQIYASILLSYFGEEQAHELLIAVFSQKPEVVNYLFDEIITEDLCWMLYNTCGGRPDSMKRLLANEIVCPFVRSATARGLLFGVSEGKFKRSDILDYFISFYESFDGNADHDFLDYLASSLCDLCPSEHIDKIENYFKQNKIFPEMVTFKSFKNAIEYGLESVYEDKKKFLSKKINMDMHRYFERWSCFQSQNGPEQSKKSANANSSLLSSRSSDSDKGVTPVAPKSKISRNDPCPCGSGKKYKKCCLLKT